MFEGRISGEELLELPLGQFDGEIVTVDTAGMAKSAARYLRNFQAIGFDTETRPAFKKGESYKVALLQLATNEKAFIIRIRKTGLPPAISELLADPGVLKAGVAIRDDLKALQKIQSFRPAGFIELQEKAKLMGINDYSLKKLCAILLGFRISKSQQLSNWESDQLTEQQLLYAATDAWVSLKIHEKLVQIAKDGTML
jgi:ribonuclease D